MDAQDSPPEQTRWLPDDQLVPAVLAGGTKDFRTLGEEDLAWVVAGLGAAGMKAEDIAERLCCSLRHIRTVRSWPMTQVCTYALVETYAFTNEVRLLQSKITAVNARLADSEDLLRRTKDKLDRMIDHQIVGAECCRRCGTAWDYGNTYWCKGKRYCRECNRRKQIDYRATLRVVKGAEAAVIELIGSGRDPSAEIPVDSDR